MSAKAGRRLPGRKPENSRRENAAKADGAFGKEGIDRVKTGTTSGNIDKSVERAVRRSGAGS